MPHPLRILVVDDNPDMADSTALLLDLFGYEARVAHDGPTALSDAAAFPPDVVLLDLRLGQTNGLRLAADLLGRLPERPVLVAVTGSPHLENECRAAGFDHYPFKPVAPERLTDLLAAISARVAVPA